MTGLPRALKPWAHLLAMFPEELALSLAPWVQRIASAVGPLGDGASTPTHEVDGYDGIARRGHPEQLLMSEWLLADAMPEEFERRAAMQEQSFLARAFRGPRAVHGSAAVFDAGPDQLGAPRIAQLASLLVLAARAEAVRAEFRWGVLQQSPNTWRTTVTPDSVLELLTARTWMPVDPAQVAGWMERSELKPPHDFWVVGGPSVHESFGVSSTSRISIDEPCGGELRQLSVAVEARLRRRQFTLDLPEAHACIRLLRNPFEKPRPPPRQAARLPRCGSNLVISGDARTLLYRTEDGRLVAQPIPNSPAARPATPVIWRAEADHTIVAAGRGGLAEKTRGTRVEVVTVKGEQLTVWSLGRNGGIHAWRMFERHSRSAAVTPRPDVLGMFDRVSGVGSVRRLLMFDGHSYVAELLPGGQFLADVPAEKFVPCGARALAARRAMSEAGKGALVASMSEGAGWMPLPIETSDVDAELFVGASGWNAGMAGLWGYGPPGGQITLCDPGSHTRLLQAPAGTRVVGVVPSGLLLLESGRRAVSRISLEGAVQLFRSAAPIVHVATSARAPLLAIATSGGELAVIDTLRGRVVWEALANWTGDAE